MIFGIININLEEIKKFIIMINHLSGIYYLENTGIANTTWWYGSNNMFPGGHFDYVCFRS